MMTPKLIEYIRKCRKQGFPDEQIREALRERGWPEMEIRQAMFKSLRFKRLPTWLSVTSIVILVLAVGFTAWGAIFMLKDISRTSSEIAEMTKDVRRFEKPYADWETYRNEEYGFEVKYPNDFVVEQKNSTINFHPLEPNPSIFYPSITVFDETLEDRIQALKILFKISTSPFSKVISDAEIAQGNYEGRELIFQSEMGHEMRYVLLVHNSKIYQLEADNFNVEGLRDIVSHMLSTFEFIEPEQTGFCGWSTNGQCSSDTDCMTGGCSGQVCQSKSEEPVITTCEYRDCYDDSEYGVVCGCVEGECKWGLPR